MRRKASASNKLEHLIREGLLDLLVDDDVDQQLFDTVVERLVVEICAEFDLR